MSDTLHAYHLPGLEDEDVTRWHTREYGDGALALRFPVLSPGALGRLAARLRRARTEHLAERPVAEVVRAVDAVAGRLAREGEPAREEALSALPTITGYTPPMARLVLDGMLRDWRADALRALLEAELEDPGMLDGFRPQPGRGVRRRVRAFGPGLAFHIFAGNVPGVAVTSLIRSLLVKAATLGKTASGEPLLPVLFARMLAHAAPGLGQCLAVTYWPGGSSEREGAAFEHADTVVVYGGRETETDVRQRLPAGTRLVTHGPRFSFGAVGREALDASSARETARAAARAAAVFDQRGCVSPHLFYVESGGAAGPMEFAEALADAMARLEEELPRGRLTAAEAARIHQARGAAEFRPPEGGTVRVHASRGTEYTVIYEADPAFAPSCLNRVVRVKPVGRLEEIVDHVRPYAAYLQTVGVVGAVERVGALATALGRLGASRITDFERMPWPQAMWHHDGRGPLRELLHWVDLES